MEHQESELPQQEALWASLESDHEEKPSNIIIFQDALPFLIQKYFDEINERAKHVEILYDPSRNQFIKFCNFVSGH